jgi:hypothetical protein
MYLSYLTREKQRGRISYTKRTCYIEYLTQNEPVTQNILHKTNLLHRISYTKRTCYIEYPTQNKPVTKNILHKTNLLHRISYTKRTCCTEILASNLIERNNINFLGLEMTRKVKQINIEIFRKPTTTDIPSY